MRVTYREPLIVQKLSPVMKGLVETRARADGQCNKLARLIGTLSADLQRARAERDACDLLIAKINSHVRPDQIEPINAHQGAMALAALCAAPSSP